MLPAPRFHHLHLNSLDPDTAIAFYTRVFPTTKRSAWGGLPALASPNDVLILFSRVATPPPTAPQSALWHFGWHVADTRASLETARRHADRAPLPAFVEQEFRDFLTCGVLTDGFARLRCTDCALKEDLEMLVDHATTARRARRRVGGSRRR